MFSGPDRFEEWAKLQRLFQKGEQAEARAYLDEIMPHFRETTDDLRLMFYIGMLLDKDAYEAGLHYYAGWKGTQLSEFDDYRCAAYLYTVTHSIPPRTLREKPYIVPRFLEVTGYRPKEAFPSKYPEYTGPTPPRN